MVRRQRTVEKLVMNTNFWQGKRVLVTGHTGFKGGWLSLWLQSMGAEVIGYALAAPSTPNLFEVARVADGMTHIHGDVRDLARLHEVMARHAPEVVFHLAAQALVRRSYSEPVETFESNVMGTVNVFEAIRRAQGVKAVVNVTSDKCYENREWVWGYRENDAMGGYDPYSSSKGCAELVTAAWRNSYFNPQRHAEHGVALASVRAGNVIGGGDWAEDRLIPDFMRAMAAGSPLVIRNPAAIRPWQHVLEPLAGYLMLAEKLWQDGPVYAEGFNFGPADEDAKSVGWIAARLTQLWGEGASWEHDGSPQPHEARYLKLDCSKVRAQIGWQPRWALDDALAQVVAWYQGYRNGLDMRALTLAQIGEYMEGSKS